MHNFFFMTSGKELPHPGPQKEAKGSLASPWSVIVLSLPGSPDSLSTRSGKLAPHDMPLLWGFRSCTARRQEQTLQGPPARPSSSWEGPRPAFFHEVILIKHNP